MNMRTTTGRAGSRIGLSVGVALLAVGSLAPMADLSARPNFSLPFPCGQTWSGQTRTNHSPQPSIDFNRTNDAGDTVVASAGGKVITRRDLGNTSYGKYLVIDHGNGWTSYYAHLSSFSVSEGQSVSKGQKIGAVGNTGGSTGDHLHYEQRLNGSYQSVYFDGVKAYYWGTKSYKSQNSCGSSGNATGTINTSGGPLNVRSGPGTGYAIVGTVNDGQKVTIYCQKNGETVTGTYGTTKLWDRIGSGRFVSDAYVHTGSDGRVAPWCN